MRKNPISVDAKIYFDAAIKTVDRNVSRKSYHISFPVGIHCHSVVILIKSNAVGIYFMFL